MRKSRQRETVLASVRSLIGTHPTADSVCSFARKTLPKISLATVYRNLNSLCANGEILRITTDLGDRFDSNIEVHAHGICSECGNIIDIPLIETGKILSEAKAQGFETTSVSVTLFGICSNCKSKNK